ncbi:MAG: glycosyltransferase [Paracoccus sp. (in: a-proteobacteria)]|nr:glycosyltransferase [Paracoccus sp. (in: a-proteobacteria)]
MNRFARRRYRAMLSRHPRAALWLKRALYPALMAVNRVIARGDYPALFAPASDAGLAARFQRETAPYAPLVSVIVPNYNHAPFLAQRIDSILAQTYPHIELILLDDASTDGSARILRDYAARLADSHHARLIVSETNSGGPFGQWQRGIAEARGDLVWIAESDDWADPHFLERLVPAFANPAVRLGFGQVIFHDGHTPLGTASERLDLPLLDAPFRLTGAEAVAQGFAHTNLISNVSAALFRRPADLSLYEPDLWRDMRVCGDWLFYLNLMRGGLLAYEPGALSYYRIHGANVSVAAHARDDFYAEHGRIAQAVARHYQMRESDRAALRERLAAIWLGARGGGLDRLDTLLQGEESAPPLRVLILSAGFAAGGAESFALNLANLLRRAGHTVTFLDCGLEPAEPALRANLSCDIPLVSEPAALPEMLAAFGFDIAHSHHAWVDQALLDADGPAARVVTLHGMYETLPEAQRNRLLARLDAQAHGLAAPAARNIEGLPDGRARIIANAADTTPAAPADLAALGAPAGAFVVTLVARAVADKGWAEAIEAVARARAQTGRDIHLLLVGAGPEADRLSAQGVPGFVHLTGLRGDVAALFAASDLAILPSTYAGESYPMAVIEALGAGVPVLASDLGQLPQMLARGAVRAGRIIPRSNGRIDIDAWAGAIAELASDPGQLAALRAAIPAVLPADDAARMVAEYVALYRDAGARLAAASGDG